MNILANVVICVFGKRTIGLVHRQSLCVSVCVCASVFVCVLYDNSKRN